MVLSDTLEALAPGLARWYWRARLEARGLARAYQGGAPGPFHRSRRRSGSPDAELSRAGQRLRDVAREMDENNDRAVAILDTLVNRVVGTGIRVQPAVRRRSGELHDGVNAAIRRLRERWSRAPEVTGELPLGEAERLTARTWLRDGEILIQHVSGRTAPYPFAADAVPYAVELIEPDLLPFELEDATRGILHGVEKDGWGRPLAYHILRGHPGDTFRPLSTTLADTRRVDARAVTHLKFARRVRQTRGVSVFHAVVRRLDDVAEYEDSERIAARVAAAACAIITKHPDQARGVDWSQRTAEDGRRPFSMHPGMVFDDLLPGESVEMIKSDRPNTSLEAFVQGQLRAAAGGTGAPYSSIARAYEGSYASQRQELVESKVNFDRLSELFICKITVEMHRRLVEAAIADGKLALPVREIDVSTLTDAIYQTPGLEWVDPAREAQAARTRWEMGITSRAQIIRERGGDPAAVFAEIEAERRRFGAPEAPAPASGPALEPPADDESDEEAAA